MSGAANELGEMVGVGGCRLLLDDTAFKASKPLVCFWLSSESLTIDPRGMAKLVRTDPVSVRFAEIRSVGLARTRFRARGVAMHLGQRGDAYLWTDDATAKRICGLLAAKGVRVVDGVEVAHW